MIDNVILLITGTLHQRAISELVPKCHPLGSFEQMEAVNIAQTPAELYNAILVDTPLGAQPYSCLCQQVAPKQTVETHSTLCESCLLLSAAAFFQDCISEQDLDEMNIEIIRNTLYKVEEILNMAAVEVMCFFSILRTVLIRTNIQRCVKQGSCSLLAPVLRPHFLKEPVRWCHKHKT